MVRSLRAGLDQYQDPNVQRQIEQIMAQRVPSNPVQGVQYIFDRWRAGQMRRKGQRELGELTKALTEGDENRTTITPARDATEAVTNLELYEMDGPIDPRLAEKPAGDIIGEDLQATDSLEEAAPAMNARMAQINPESGALYGRKVALGKLLQDNPNNYAAQQALLANNQLLASQDANLQLQRLKNENVLKTARQNQIDRLAVEQFKIDNRPPVRHTTGLQDGIQIWTSGPNAGKPVTEGKQGENETFFKMMGIQNPASAPGGPASAPGGSALPMSGSNALVRPLEAQNVSQQTDSSSPIPGVINANQEIISVVSQEAAKRGLSPRELFDSLSDREKAGIMLAPKKMKAFSNLLLDKAVARAGKQDWAKKTTNELQKDLLDADSTFIRLRDIKAKFKPTFLTYATGLRNTLNSLKDKAGFQLTPEDSRELTLYSEFKRAAANNLNLYIKLITGAQMSVQEAGRIQRAMPTPGDSWYDGDSPTQFKAKMDGVLQQIYLSRARNKYILQNKDKWISELGSDQEIKAQKIAARLPLAEMGRIIDKRGEQLAKSFRIKYRNLGLSSDQIDKQYVLPALNKEFGMGI